MSARRRRKILPLAAIVVAASLTTQPTFAFSMIESNQGDGGSKEGILAQPLPPLMGATSTIDSTPPTVEKPASPAQTPAAGAPAPDSPTPPPPPAATPQVTTPAPNAGDSAAPAVPAPQLTPGTTPPAAGASGDEDKNLSAVPPKIYYGDDGLPPPVKQLRQRLIDIAKSGDIDALRPYIEPGDNGTVLSFGGVDGDPIEFLKQASGDGQGLEILAILLETLNAGHVENDPGTDEHIYVWPYFTQMALDKLSKQQMVELFELVTAGDWEEMKAFGAYNFYRVGITPDGKLQFFVAGD